MVYPSFCNRRRKTTSHQHQLSKASVIVPPCFDTTFVTPMAMRHRSPNVMLGSDKKALNGAEGERGKLCKEVLQCFRSDQTHYYHPLPTPRLTPSASCQQGLCFIRSIGSQSQAKGMEINEKSISG